MGNSPVSSMVEQSGGHNPDLITDLLEPRAATADDHNSYQAPVRVFVYFIIIFLYLSLLERPVARRGPMAQDIPHGHSTGAHLIRPIVSLICTRRVAHCFVTFSDEAR